MTGRSSGSIERDGGDIGGISCRVGKEGGKEERTWSKAASTVDAGLCEDTKEENPLPRRAPRLGSSAAESTYSIPPTFWVAEASTEAARNAKSVTTSCHFICTRGQQDTRKAGYKKVSGWIKMLTMRWHNSKIKKRRRKGGTRSDSEGNERQEQLWGTNEAHFEGPEVGVATNTGGSRRNIE